MEEGNGVKKRDEIEKTEAIDEDELRIHVEGQKVGEKKQKGKEGHNGEQIGYLGYKPISETQEGKEDESVGEKATVEHKERKENVKQEGKVEPEKTEKLEF